MQSIVGIQGFRTLGAKEDAKGFVQLLLKLQKLQEINFSVNNWNYTKIFQGLFDYLKKYDKAMNLKVRT